MPSIMFMFKGKNHVQEKEKKNPLSVDPKINLDVFKECRASCLIKNWVIKKEKKRKACDVYFSHMISTCILNNISILSRKLKDHDLF